MSSVEKLEAIIKDLENKLEATKRRTVIRPKINYMSAEVIDSNPYR